MKTSDHQFEFMKDLLLLLDFIINVKKFKITGGWLERNEMVQRMLVDKGLSKTMDSNHLKKCAIDLNFFIDGIYNMDKELLTEVGVFWENLNSLNRWGGFFKGFGKNGDSGHFERNI